MPGSSERGSSLRRGCPGPGHMKSMTGFYRVASAAPADDDDQAGSKSWGRALRSHRALVGLIFATCFPQAREPDKPGGVVENHRCCPLPTDHGRRRRRCVFFISRNQSLLTAAGPSPCLLQYLKTSATYLAGSLYRGHPETHSKAYIGIGKQTRERRERREKGLQQRPCILTLPTSLPSCSSRLPNYVPNLREWAHYLLVWSEGR